MSRSTVVNILRQNNFDPKFDPTKGSWGAFFKAHANTLWQCDFFQRHIVTASGIRQIFTLAFLHVATRRVYLPPCTFKPDAAWLRGQAHDFLKYATSSGSFRPFSTSALTSSLSLAKSTWIFWQVSF